MSLRRERGARRVTRLAVLALRRGARDASGARGERPLAVGSGESGRHQNFSSAAQAAATQREASHAASRRFKRPRANAAVRVRPFQVRGASLARCRWTRQQKG